MSDDQRIPVRTALDSYRVAIAELPTTCRLAVDGERAVVVVDGRGRWWERASDALGHDPLALIIADPGAAPPDRIGELAEAARECPVVLDRPLVHGDVIQAVLSARGADAVATVVAECSTGEASLDVVVREASAWLRILGVAPVSVRDAASTPRTRIARLGPSDGRPGLVATLKADIVGTHDTSAFLRILALGETRSELTFDTAAGRSTVVTTTRAGSQLAPDRFEEPARRILRRALQALAEASVPTDLRELHQDSVVSARIVSSGARP